MDRHGRRSSFNLDLITLSTDGFQKVDLFLRLIRWFRQLAYIITSLILILFNPIVLRASMNILCQNCQFCRSVHLLVTLMKCVYCVEMAELILEIEATLGKLAYSTG